MVTRARMQMRQRRRAIAQNPHAIRVIVKTFYWIAWAIATWLFTLGLAIFFGGEMRTTGPGFKNLNYVADLIGGPTYIVWSFPLMFTAILLWIGIYLGEHPAGFWCRCSGYFIGGWCATSLAIAFGTAAFQVPSVALTGIPTYGFTGAVQFIMLAGSILLSQIMKESRG